MRLFQLLFTVTVAVAVTVTATATASSTALAQFVGDPCVLAGNQSANSIAAFGNSAAGPDPSDENLLLGMSLPRARRLKVVCELKSAVLEKYALIQLKKERLNIDVDQHMQDCAREELNIYQRRSPGVF